MALSYNLGYQESISVHPTRRQNFAGKPYSIFPNIWEWLIYVIISWRFWRLHYLATSIMRTIMITLMTSVIFVIVRMKKIIHKSLVILILILITNGKWRRLDTIAFVICFVCTPFSLWCRWEATRTTCTEWFSTSPHLATSRGRRYGHTNKYMISHQVIK